MSHDEITQVARQLNGPPRSQSISNTLMRPFLAQIARYWWVELLVGVLWVVIAVVVLKFNHASVVTVSVFTGITFLVLRPRSSHWPRWTGAPDGCGRCLVCCSRQPASWPDPPRNTFAGFADIVDFVFLLIGILWMVQALTERAFKGLWWLGLISGILMVVLAFWISGEFFVDRAFTMLLFEESGR